MGAVNLIQTALLTGTLEQRAQPIYFPLCEVGDPVGLGNSLHSLAWFGSPNKAS